MLLSTTQYRPGYSPSVSTCRPMPKFRAVFPSKPETFLDLMLRKRNYSLMKNLNTHDIILLFQDKIFTVEFDYLRRVRVLL